MFPVAGIRYIIREYRDGVAVAASVPYTTEQEGRHYYLRMKVHRPQRDYRLYKVTAEGEELLAPLSQS